MSLTEPHAVLLCCLIPAPVASAVCECLLSFLAHPPEMSASVSEPALITSFIQLSHSTEQPNELPLSLTPGFGLMTLHTAALFSENDVQFENNQ